MAVITTLILTRHGEAHCKVARIVGGDRSCTGPTDRGRSAGRPADGGAGGRAPPRPAGTAAIGAVVHLLATAIEEGRDLSSMSGILADTAYRLLLA